MIAGFLKCSSTWHVAVDPVIKILYFRIILCQLMQTFLNYFHVFHHVCFYRFLSPLLLPNSLMLQACLMTPMLSAVAWLTCMIGFATDWLSDGDLVVELGSVPVVCLPWVRTKPKTRRLAASCPSMTTRVMDPVQVIIRRMICQLLIVMEPTVIQKSCFQLWNKTVMMSQSWSRFLIFGPMVFWCFLMKMDEKCFKLGCFSSDFLACLMYAKLAWYIFFYYDIFYMKDSIAQITFRLNSGHKSCLSIRHFA